MSKCGRAANAIGARASSTTPKLESIVAALCQTGARPSYASSTLSGSALIYVSVREHLLDHWWILHPEEFPEPSCAESRMLLSRCVRIMLTDVLDACAVLCVCVCVRAYRIPAQLSFSSQAATAGTAAATSATDIGKSGTQQCFALYMYISRNTYTQIYICIYIYISICIHAHTHTHTYIYIYIYIYIYLYVYTHSALNPPQDASLSPAARERRAVGKDSHGPQILYKSFSSAEIQPKKQ